MRLILGVTFLAVVTLVAGCGGKTGPTKYRVTGLVTVDNEPIKKGYIIFQPTSPDDRAEGASIADGKYELTAMAGDKKVEIRGARTTGEKGPKGEDVEENYVPERYNQKTELTAKVTDREKENKFDFALKVKP